ncbi:hypothetical protein L6164_018519 [Bauhinia variegata]|uniref:Uncharacterized protein n=1 Tax=Bauhinia variegata TaxID=167791 RepID=A0ACB9NBH2_BAUVA|nr:hypothetical protein L6164_018519 [Bauhinia variegata]
MAVSEWKLPTRREEEAVGKYLEEERNFMAAENYYVNDHAVQIRRYAVQLVTKFSQGNTDDAFVFYLAMNYFDRYVSRHGLPNNQGTEEDTIQWLVVCCITIASKMRRKSFTVDSFLADKHLEIPLQRIMEGELLILNALEWRMRPITPICYLDHYYPKFVALGGLSRRCINEIIVQSQGELSFTRARPSEIALSSLVAAATILYPGQASSINDTVRSRNDTWIYHSYSGFCWLTNIVVVVPVS